MTARENNKIEVCDKKDTNYPKRLREIQKSPGRLFYRGDITILNEMTSIAIIGSREASEQGLKMTFLYSKIAAEEGFVVTNGLALGCDTMALEGALSVGGKCVAVMPCGLDSVYPKSNEALVEKILLNGGCLISEYPPGTQPQKQYFVERDRLQSGISVGVVVIETKETGGTMHTVKYAEKQGRRVACYYSELLQNAEGNQLIVDTGRGEPIDTGDHAREYYIRIKKDSETKYEQMTLSL